MSKSEKPMTTEYLNQPNYEAWNWNYRAFPRNGTSQDQIVFCIKAGLLAPNTHNSQPWHFKIIDNVLTIQPDPKHRLPQADPQDKMLFISLGCCLQNIECAANYGGLSTIEHISDAGILIEFTPDQNAAESTAASLCPQITRRVSNKLPYSPTPIPQSVLELLRARSVPGAEIHIVSDKDKILLASKQMELAVRKLAKNRNFAFELSHWLKLGNTKDFDGMPAFVAGLTDKQAIAAKFALEHIPGAMNAIASKDGSLVATSPAIGVISSTGNTTFECVNVGKAYELLALTATQEKISSAPMHAIVDNQDGRVALSQIFGLSKHDHPQFFFRLGYSNTVPKHTPRRGIDRVLL